MDHKEHVELPFIGSGSEDFLVTLLFFEIVGVLMIARVAYLFAGKEPPESEKKSSKNPWKCPKCGAVNH